MRRIDFDEWSSQVMKSFFFFKDFRFSEHRRRANDGSNTCCILNQIALFLRLENLHVMLEKSSKSLIRGFARTSSKRKSLKFIKNVPTK